ncbi:hypothetical protein [Brevundimonas sp. FT23042]|uniref:hypothetical protein n=1 Tax=Brevundimonas sp. FT23042 TaxID=3393749 RepID=UPI003B58A885
MKQIIMTLALALSMSVAGTTTASSAALQSAQAASVQPGEAARPLLVLIEADPWASVVGADSPRLALYDDGVIIYRKDGAYRAARLAAGEVESFMSALQPEALTELAGAYSISEWTDQPTTDIFLLRDGRYLQVQVYGSMDPAAPKLDGVSFADPARLPHPLLEAYRRMVAFDPDGAVVWSPEAIEVMIWPYEYAPEESIVWPAHWPGLSDPETRQRGDDYSLFVPASEGAALRSFLQGRRQRGAVLIDGRKWAVSTRLPFPKEEEWMALGAE